MFMTRVTALAFLAVTLAAQPNPQEHDTPRLVQARKGGRFRKSWLAASPIHTPFGLKPASSCGELSPSSAST
jgi:hypothetical protein